MTSHIDFDRINNILKNRRGYHLNEFMNITYCPYDDRKNCHALVHGDTYENLVANIVDSDHADDFNARESVRDDRKGRLRSRQIAANIRGDRDTEIDLFNRWRKL